MMGTLEESSIAERKEWRRSQWKMFFQLLNYLFWTCSYHPYLFFNRDGFSMTFVGFNANKDGDLIDPIEAASIEGLERVVGAQLQAGFRQNNVNLSENYQVWTR